MGSVLRPIALVIALLGTVSSSAVQQPPPTSLVRENATVAVLARDQVQTRLAENGADPSQDGCAFHVKDLESLFSEFNAQGLNKELSAFDIEQHGDEAWKVFYVVAPDGLCYWFG